MGCQCKTDRQRAKCQFWIGPEFGLIEKNKDTNQLRVKTGCFPEVVLAWLVQLMMTDEVVAKGVIDFRNEVYKEAMEMGPVLAKLIQLREDGKPVELLSQDEKLDYSRLEYSDHRPEPGTPSPDES